MIKYGLSLSDNTAEHNQRSSNREWRVFSLLISREAFWRHCIFVVRCFQDRLLVEFNESVVIGGHLVALKPPAFDLVDSSRTPVSLQVLWCVDNGL